MFLGMLWRVWKDTQPFKHLPIRTPQLVQANNLLFFGRWSFIAALVNSVTDVLDLDATTMLVLWLVYSLLIVTRRLMLQSLRPQTC